MMALKEQRKRLEKIGVKRDMRWGKSDICLPYPGVLGEEATLDAVLLGMSIARYGDGELSLALGGKCVSQTEKHPKLQRELVEILAKPNPCLVGIPNVFSDTPKFKSWLNYASTKHVNLYKQPPYVSSFITRPDSAPWIDTVDYWNKVKSLWVNRDVTLVLGCMRSLRPDAMRAEGATVREVWGPRTNAYSEIDRIMEEVGRPSHPVLLCLGPTATVLAWRLAKLGVWAIDLGHIGMFMRHGGSYRHHLDDLSSPEMRKLLQEKHAKESWGKAGDSHIPFFLDFYRELGCETMLDYGSGQERLRIELAKREPPIRVQCYDPGIPGRDGMPKPVDFVVCTDVLEHIEPDRIDDVLDHIFTLAGKGAYLNIACRPARTTLGDGRNAHLITEPPPWWREKLVKWGGWTFVREEPSSGSYKVWLKK